LLIFYKETIKATGYKKVLDADDLFPLFTYIVVFGNPDNLLANVE